MGKILVIDDETEIREILQEMLELDGHIVFIAKDGKEGLAVSAKHKIDLVITDIFMPEQDGFETIMNLKRRNANMKIIAISGGGFFNSKESLRTAHYLGADYAINKPFEMQDLLEKVHTLLK